ncbi:MAG: hypothetical protein ACMUIS_03745 [bacterium]
MVLSLLGSARPAPGITHVRHPNSFSSQPLVVPTISTVTGDILIDNFEYWDSPYNHGWIQQEPPYPVYGFGLGYATIFSTVLDLRQGSRVLDVYRPASVFLVGTPYERHFISRPLLDPQDPTGATSINLDEGSRGTNCILYFLFRAPLGIEPWDIFQLEVFGKTSGGGDFIIQFRPLQPRAGSRLTNSGNTTHDMGGYQATLVQEGDIGTDAPMIIQVNMGRNFLDGTWHVASYCLHEVNGEAQIAANGSVDPDWELTSAEFIRVSGQMFRVDNIIFRADHHTTYDYPDLFEVGPRYAQLFEPYRYLFVADYEGGVIEGFGRSETRITDLMLDPLNFITDPAEIREIWMADLAALGEDPNYADPNSMLYGEAQPYLTEFMDRGQDFVIDINLPVFSDPNLRVGGSLSEDARLEPPLGWNATIGGYGANGVQSFLIRPLPINPYDGMPTYIPAYYTAIDAISVYGRAHYGPAQCFALESAMWNAGFTVWPNIAAMDYTPMYFEDLIVTIEVTNGAHSDVMTFPISVVNYPVENYAPVVQIDIDDQTFYVGKEPDPEAGENVYVITFVDPDCFIFSLAQFEGRQPATSHVPGFPVNEQFRTDQDNLTYRMTINGLPAYRYGPWVEEIIDPSSGLIRFTPQFEAALVTIVRCTDSLGATALGEINIFCINPGTWLNHPPVISGGPTNPVVIRAGEELILHAPLFNVHDPDGDELYATCNIGSCGRSSDGAFLWAFQSNFPGIYGVEVFFYDIRGGYAILYFPVIVKPWWSY